MTVAIYTRISQDKTGEKAGVQRQKKECGELASRRGLTVEHSLSDNDISAYSGKRRPGFEKLLKMIRGGEVNSIIVWHPDRLYRRSADLELLIELVEKHRIEILSVTAGDFDLNTPSGRAVARTLVAWSGFEVEQKSDRQRSAYRARAEAGGWGFSRRPFGYERVKGKVVQRRDEAAILKDVLERYYVRLEPRHSIMRDLNTRGITTAEGRRWTATHVRDLLTNDRYGGIVKYRDTVIDVEPQWEPIVDRETWLGWRSAAARRKRKSTFTSARYLLTGMMKCGVCGGTCYAAHGHNRMVYSCQSQRCVSRHMGRVDEVVEGVIVARLSRPDAAEVLRPEQSRGPEILASFDSVQSRLDSLAELVADGTLSAQAARDASKPLKVERDRLQDELDALRAAEAVPLDLLTGDVANKWSSLTLTQKRAVIGSLVRVTLHRQENNRRFDPETVQIEWLSEAT